MKLYRYFRKPFSQTAITLVVLLFTFIQGNTAWAVAKTVLSPHAQQGETGTPRPAEPALYFTHLTINDGLSQSVVTSILQDRYGFMWIGTEGGLNRYDGYQFTIYQYDPRDPHSLSDNYVTNLYEDVDGKLWVTTHEGGVNCFDPLTGTFTRYQHDPNDSNSLIGNRIFSVFQDSRGNLWFGGPPADGGLTRFNPATQTFTRFQESAGASPGLQRGAVWDTIEDQDGILWMAADFVLARFDPATEQFTYFSPDAADGRLATLYKDTAGVMWVGGDQGLYRFDPKTGNFTLHQPGYATTITDIFPNNDGTVWIATHGQGLYLFDTTTSQFTHQYVHDPADPYSLSHDRVSDLYQDKAGVLWVGTARGLNLYDPRRSQFAYYRHVPDNSNSLADGGVWGVTGETGGSAAGGNLWIGTGATLNQFDLSTGQVSRHPLESTESNRNDAAGAIYVDTAGFVWAGVGATLYRLDKSHGEIKTYNLQTINPPGSPPLTITALDRDGPVLWIGALRGGLIRFDLQTNTFESYLAPSPGFRGVADPRFFLTQEISTLYRDRTGAIWLGYSTGGISRLDPATHTFRHYVPDANDPQSIPGGWITGIYQDQAGTLWITSRHGLIRFDPLSDSTSAPTTGTFTLYAEKDGLPSAYVTGIQEDQHGKLWLATMKGLSQFDPQTGTFHNFDVDDGVGSTELWGPSWQNEDGRIFFGGSDGLTAFYPDRIREDPYQPPVVLTAFYLFNEPVTVGAGSLLQRPIWATDHLTLQYDQTSIAFEFAALTYTASRKNHFRYILEGVEEAWNEVDSRHHIAAYTHLPAGDFVLRVQGSNENGVWSDRAVNLAITIVPPWWETTWFRVVALALIVGLVFAGARWRERTLKQRSQELAVQVAERTKELAIRTKRLQESETRFREMSELLPGAVIEMDPEFTLTYVNKSGLELFGYSEHDIQAGANAMELLHPAEREKAFQRIASYREGKDLPPTEYRILTKAGVEIPVLLKAAPIWRGGEIKGFRASLTNIAKVKETEKALRASEEQLRFITDSVPAYVAYVGIDDLRYRFVSRKFEQGYNRPRDSIIGQHIKDIIGEENYQFALKYIDEVRAGHATSYENIFTNAQGNRWIEVNYVPTLDAQGPVEGIAVLSFDITERKRAEEALRESQEQFALFMDMLPHGVFIKEEDSTVIYVNQYLKDLFLAESWLDHDAHAAFPDHPALAEAMMADDRTALAQGQTRVEEAMPDKDGNERVFVTTKFRIPRVNKPPLLGGIGLDITDRVKAERELAAALMTARQLRDEAEAANRAKSTFLANISHELRTPLNAILGYSQLMARDAHLAPPQQAYLETIARSGEHLLGLINNVLTLSKIEAGRTTLQENTFDLHQQLHGLQEMFQMRAADKGLALLLNIAPNVPRYVFADEGKLRQVLMNLFSNAVKFTNEGRIALHVTLDEKKASSGTAVAPCVIAFQVEDTGVGIAPQEMADLFEPFVQTASGQQSQEGTGLGLPITRQFVTMMGGELDVHSAEGQGTTFRVRIPVALADVAAVKAIGLRPPRRITGIEPDQTAPDGGPFRLLIVEDSPTNREVLIELLRPFGFDVRYAVNGAAGVELWETWQPHLVWMDMRMPVMNGYEATRQIKSRAAALNRQVIVVALTASAFEEDRQTILAAGCDDFVRKPFREHEILEILHRQLGVRFIYEAAAPAPESLSPEELRAAVQALPAEWTVDLHQAILALDIDRMLALLEAIRPQAAYLADTLTQWVHDFEYDRLMALVAPQA